MKTIYELAENEQTTVKATGEGQYPYVWTVQRVPGGWIYQEENPRITRTPMIVFIPFSAEFQPTKPIVNQ